MFSGKTGFQNLPHIVTRSTAEGARSTYVNISFNCTRWRKKHGFSKSDVVENDDKIGSLHDSHVTNLSYVQRTQLCAYLFRLFPYTEKNIFYSEF
jgi:hypothetical protein